MYPKVKVRDHEDFLQPFDDSESQSTDDSSSSVSEHQVDSSPQKIKIANPYIPISVLPKVSGVKGTKKNDYKIEEDEKPSIRVGSFLRPRAVLSSPINDGVIGSKISLKSDQPPVLKNHNKTENRHSHCKVSATITHTPTTTKTSITEIPTNMKRSITEIPANTKRSITEIPANTKRSIIKIPANTKRSITEIPANTKKSITEIPTNTKISITEIPTNTKRSITENPVNTKRSITENSINTRRSITEIPPNTKKSKEVGVGN